MFGFIVNTVKSILGVVTGSWQSAISAVINWIGSLEHAHYGYWHTVTVHTGDAWKALTRTLLYLRTYMQEFMFAQGLLDTLIMKHLFPWIENWIAWLGGRVKQEINATIVMLRREYKAGDNAQHAYTRSVLVWVVIHVLTFLYRLVLRIFSWIGGIGSTMWHYFTHLADFAELLIMALVASLERHAWDIGKLLGTFFLSLIVHNMVRFAKLVEDIVDAVL